MAKKLAGTVVEWNDALGYGYLQCGSTRVFLHRREFSERGKQIELGDQIVFVTGSDKFGRSCATQAAHVSHGENLLKGPLLIVGLLLILPGFALTLVRIPWPYTGSYFVAINLLTFLFYASDKKKARKHAWRIPESTLHLLELLGGWPAAFLAQQSLRHKTFKMSYQIIFWLVVAAYQAAAWDLIQGGSWTRNALKSAGF